MLWFYLAATSVIFFAFLNLLQRKLSVASSDPRSLAVVFNSIAAIFAFLYFVVSGGFGDAKLPQDRESWFYILFALLAFGMYERFRFHVAKMLDASIFTIVGNVSILVAFIGALFLYSETLTTAKLFGSLLILIALFLVGKVAAKGAKGSTKGVLWGMGISIILGLGWMLDKKGAESFGPNLYNVLVWSLPTFIILLPSIKLAPVLATLKTSWKQISLMAFLNMSGYLMQLKAVSLSEATKVIPVVQTSTLATVVLGIFLLKETDNIVLKIVSGALALMGVYLLVAF